MPAELADDVDVSAYRQDGYAGSVLRFSGLTFDQARSADSAAAGPAGETVQFSMRRAGNRVLVTGQVDLTTVPVDQADFQLKISSPGEVLDTNGDAEAGTVSWTFTPGEVGDVNAVIVGLDDPNAPSPVNWTLLTATLVALAAARWCCSPAAPATPRSPASADPAA